MLPMSPDLVNGTRDRRMGVLPWHQLTHPPHSHYGAPLLAAHDLQEGDGLVSCSGSLGVKSEPGRARDTAAEQGTPGF